MTELGDAIISDLEDAAALLVRGCYRVPPELRVKAHKSLREVFESLEFFSAPRETLETCALAYNVLSAFLYGPKELARDCLDLFILPPGMTKELDKSDDHAARRKLLSYILNESYLGLSEEELTTEVTARDAHYLKLVQSLSQIDHEVAKGYAENYNNLLRGKLKSKREIKKLKKIVSVPIWEHFGMVLE